MVFFTQLFLCRPCLAHSGEKMDSTTLLTGEKRRSRTKIIATIFKITENGESRTKIAEKAHLNSQQLQLYLNRLAKLDLVEINSANRRRIYITSEKGIQYLRQYNMLKELLKKR